MSTVTRTEAQISELGVVIRSDMRPRLHLPGLSEILSSDIRPFVCSNVIQIRRSYTSQSARNRSLEIVEAIGPTAGTLSIPLDIPELICRGAQQDCLPRCWRKVSFANDVPPTPGSLSPKNGVCSTLHFPSRLILRMSNPSFTGHAPKQRCHIPGILNSVASEHQTLHWSVKVL